MTSTSQPQTGSNHPISSWGEAIASATVHYSVWGGRKFTVLYAETSLTLSLNEIIRKSNALLSKSYSDTTSLRDSPSLRSACEELVYFSRDLQQVIQDKDSQAEKDRGVYLSSRNAHFLDLFIQLVLTVYRVVRSLFFSREALYNSVFRENPSQLYPNPLYSVTQSINALANTMISNLDCEIPRAAYDLATDLDPRNQASWNETSTYERADIWLCDDRGVAYSANEILSEKEWAQIVKYANDKAAAEVLAWENRQNEMSAKIRRLLEGYCYFYSFLEGSESSATSEPKETIDWSRLQELQVPPNLQPTLDTLNAGQEGQEWKAFGLESTYSREQLQQAKNRIFLVVHPDKNKDHQELANTLFLISMEIYTILDQRLKDQSS
jgi:hypothetical protein